VLATLEVPTVASYPDSTLWGSGSCSWWWITCAVWQLIERC